MYIGRGRVKEETNMNGREQQHSKTEYDTIFLLIVTTFIVIRNLSAVYLIFKKQSSVVSQGNEVFLVGTSEISRLTEVFFTGFRYIYIHIAISNVRSCSRNCK